MFHEFFPTLTTDLHGRWESYRVFMAPVNWRLESGDRFELNVAPAGERLTEPFEIVEGVVIPPGAYDWLRYRVEVGTAAKRKLSGQATWWFGGFYTGTLDQIELEASWTPSPIVTFLVNAERDIGRLERGRLRPHPRGHQGAPEPLARPASSTASCSTTPRSAPSARTRACAGPSTRAATCS